jgi:hypothetical protein
VKREEEKTQKRKGESLDQWRGGTIKEGNEEERGEIG